MMTVYLQDTLAWATNLVFEQNLLTGNSLKPSTYNIYRNPPIEWFLGAPGLGDSHEPSDEVMFQFGRQDDRPSDDAPSAREDDSTPIED